MPELLDLRVEVPVIPPAQLAGAADGETSANVAEPPVATAQERALARQGCVNAQFTSRGVDQHCEAEPAAQKLLQKVAVQLAWSGPSYHHLLRVARTIADLTDTERITPAQMGEAVQLRRGLQAACRG